MEKKLKIGVVVADGEEFKPLKETAKIQSVVHAAKACNFIDRKIRFTQ